MNRFRVLTHTEIEPKVISRRCSVICLALLFLLLTPPTTTPAFASPGRVTEIEVFVREGCPRCVAVKAFLDELGQDRPDLHISIVDIERNPDARDRLETLTRLTGDALPGVPTIRIGTTLIVGFDTPATTGTKIRGLLSGSSADDQNHGGATCGTDVPLTCAAPQEDTVEIPLIERRITVQDLGLPLFTVIMGLLDGLNPCSMWVLILMLSMLASVHDRRKMLAVVGTFVAIEGIAYFAFMAAWLNLFLFIGLSRPSEIVVGCLAIVAGVINLKDCVAFGRGISLSIPTAAKPGVYARLRTILHAERLWPAMVGAAILAILMQAVELLCTSGFPALYTRILTLRQLDQVAYYGYLMLYNVMYMLDDMIILGIGLVTLSQRRLQEREGRALKLMAGVAMLGLGIYLLTLR
jgi:glutaredoxin